MTAPRGTPEHQQLLDAASSVLQRIQSRATELDPAITTAELERDLCIKPRSDTSRPGATFEKYRDGRWEGVYGTLVQKIRIATSKNWLIREDLQELGLEDVAGSAQPANDIKKNRQKAAKRFMTGQEREIGGLLPVAMRGPKGRLPRPPKDEAEAAQEHAAWIAGIEELGGQLKPERWAPAWYRANQAHVNSVFEKFHNAYKNYSMAMGTRERASERPTEAVFPFSSSLPLPYPTYAPPNPPLPAHHPENVKKLKLWFGGREYSPLAHAIEKDWFDLGDGFETREDWDLFFDETIPALSTELGKGPSVMLDRPQVRPLLRIPMLYQTVLAAYYARVMCCEFTLDGAPLFASEVFHEMGFLPLIVEVARQKFGCKLGVEIVSDDAGLCGRRIMFEDLDGACEPILLLKLLRGAEIMFGRRRDRKIDLMPHYQHCWSS
jgi:hypothetical protein